MDILKSNSTPPQLPYSDYIIYVDESGDHSIESINSRYPLFVLSFCIIRKDTYAQYISPALMRLKFSLFGHDMVIFHEHEIRKKLGAFKTLGKFQREHLLNSLSHLISQFDFTIIPIIIDKIALKCSSFDFPHVYHLAMKLGLEQVYKFLSLKGQKDVKTHIVFEARGRIEDLGLEMEFKRVCDSQNSIEKTLPLEIILADKKTNSAGLQLADMVARPIGLSILRPYQQNQAFDILREKIFREDKTKNDLYVYPIKAKGPEADLEAQAPVG
ncbi:MAG: DUF3800 domain-containing protein [Verrucomicrobia bacterium]|nr:DUF3800 domain-containing protein [Verrucomicrobiota bacterium]